MRRREFIALVGAAAVASPLAVRAQQSERVRRLGALISIGETDPEMSPRIAAFEQELRKLGWDIGRGVRIEYRFGAGDTNRMRMHAADLVAMKPDVIFASGTQTVSALQRATSDITGFCNLEYTIGGKWVSILKEIAPHIARAVAILDRQNIAATGHFAAVQIAAASIGLQLNGMGVRDAAEIEQAIDAVAREPNGSLIFLPSPVITANRDRGIPRVARQRLPAMYAYAYFAKSGGLVSYGVDIVDQYRRAPTYIDRILRGENPSNLPVQNPTKLELVINLKTAKALGLTVPPSLLARADEVIE